MSDTVKIFLIVFVPTLLVFGLGVFAAVTVGGWLGTPLIMLGMAMLCLSEYWVRPVMRRLLRDGLD